MNVRPAFIVLLVVTAILCSWSAIRFSPKLRHSNLHESSPANRVHEVAESPQPLSTNRPSLKPPTAPENSKVSRIADIVERRDEKIAEIKRRAGGFETENDHREIAEISRKADEEAKALLSDGEKRALQVERFKQSDLGKALVEHYGASDMELEAISDHENAIAEVIAAKGDLEGVQARSLERMEKILGTERLKEYMNYRDPDYVEALNFMKRFNLRPETAMELMKLRVEHGKLALESIKQLKPPDGLSEPFRSRVRELLGPEPGEIYIREAKGGLWLR